MLAEIKIPHISMWGGQKLLKKVSKRQLSRFCAQLAILLSSGVSLLDALNIVRNILLKRELNHLIEQLSNGSSLAEAMKKSFPPLLVSSIECAERTGSLEEVLNRLAKYYEERAEVEEKIKSALIYPSFVIVLCLVSLIVIFLFVLPGFKSLFLDLEADLPLFTRAILGIGEFLSAAWYLPVILILFLLGIIVYYKKERRTALLVDGWLLKIRFFAREQIVHSFRTLGSLLEAGVSIIEALGNTINSSKNKAFQKILTQTKAGIEHGEKLSQLLERHKIFTSEIIQMLSVGENSGKLAEMLLSIADFYEKERELFIKRFTSMLEPALTLFVGIVVGIVALAVFMPMMNLISLLQ